ncbi:MAG: stage sporulation protein [Peptococcaceae bacterium]|jgi:stage V sporulation protein AD|nr:stage sporulation protein [Peptococcaceae bacterium]
MVLKKLGKQTLQFNSMPSIKSWASVVGPMEGQGPLAEYFDVIWDNTLGSEKTWEKAEQKLMQYSMELALEKAALLPTDLDFYLAGDLLNQIITANFTAGSLGIPFFGLFGACSTLAEGLALAGILIDGGYAAKVGVSASSHHDTAERQFRFPTEFGVQRPMTAQWTVTGCGSFVVENKSNGFKITQATIGKVVDMGTMNANDMGTAMAPAAFDTIQTHLQDTGRKIDDYDLIITGDLGLLGNNILKELLKKQGMDTGNVSDCGILIYSPEQDTHSGGSGCGCSAVVLAGYLLEQMRKGLYKRIFLVGTGALLSPTSTFQGNSIPCIAHGVVLEYS